MLDDGAFEPDRRRHRPSGLRLLCLHGYGSNNDITHMQITHLQLRELHGVSCDFLHAEEEVMAQDSVFYDFSEKPFHSWFNYSWLKTGKNGVGAPGGSLYKSLQRIMSVYAKHGPYDGIYGFSQGGFMAAALCNPTVYNGLFGYEQCPFRFAILACAALSDTLTQVEVAQRPPAATDEPVDAKAVKAVAPLQLPVASSTCASLHIIGQRDWVKSSSLAHVKHFEDSTSYTHAYGHEMPMKLYEDEKLIAIVRGFLGRFMLHAPPPTPAMSYSEPLWG